ncbi:MAG: hypothetical protein AAGH15_13645, partial [Myxococcota bacterium]
GELPPGTSFGDAYRGIRDEARGFQAGVDEGQRRTGDVLGMAPMAAMPMASLGRVGVAGAATDGAIYGGIEGFGNSEGETAGEVVGDALEGAAWGGAFGGGAALGLAGQRRLAQGPAPAPQIPRAPGAAPPNERVAEAVDGGIPESAQPTLAELLPPANPSSVVPDGAAFRPPRLAMSPEVPESALRQLDDTDLLLGHSPSELHGGVEAGGRAIVDEGYPIFSLEGEPVFPGAERAYEDVGGPLSAYVTGGPAARGVAPETLSPLTQRELAPSDLVRGLALPDEQLAGLTPGQSFDLGPVASFSDDPAVAMRFGRQPEAGQSQVLLRTHARRGADLRSINEGEREVLLSGGARVTGREEVPLTGRDLRRARRAGRPESVTALDLELENNVPTVSGARQAAPTFDVTGREAPAEAAYDLPPSEMVDIAAGARMTAPDLPDPVRAGLPMGRGGYRPPEPPRRPGLAGRLAEGADMLERQARVQRLRQAIAGKDTRRPELARVGRSVPGHRGRPLGDNIERFAETAQELGLAPTGGLAGTASLRLQGEAIRQRFGAELQDLQRSLANELVDTSPMVAALDRAIAGTASTTLDDGARAMLRRERQALEQRMGPLTFDELLAMRQRAGAEVRRLRSRQENPVAHEARERLYKQMEREVVRRSRGAEGAAAYLDAQRRFAVAQEMAAAAGNADARSAGNSPIGLLDLLAAGGGGAGAGGLGAILAPAAVRVARTPAVEAMALGGAARLTRGASAVAESATADAGAAGAALQRLVRASAGAPGEAPESVSPEREAELRELLTPAAEAEPDVTRERAEELRALLGGGS